MEAKRYALELEMEKIGKSIQDKSLSENKKIKLALLADQQNK